MKKKFHESSTKKTFSHERYVSHQREEKKERNSDFGRKYYSPPRVHRFTHLTRAHWTSLGVTRSLLFFSLLLLLLLRDRAFFFFFRMIHSSRVVVVCRLRTTTKTSSSPPARRDRPWWAWMKADETNRRAHSSAASTDDCCSLQETAEKSKFLGLFVSF